MAEASGFLRLVTCFGFVPIVIGGFFTAFGASGVVSEGSAALSAFEVWQYTFVAAVIADVAVFVMALLTPTHVSQAGNSG